MNKFIKKREADDDRKAEQQEQPTAQVLPPNHRERKALRREAALAEANAAVEARQKRKGARE